MLLRQVTRGKVPGKLENAVLGVLVRRYLVKLNKKKAKRTTGKRGYPW
jgi:hypothetical protein